MSERDTNLTDLSFWENYWKEKDRAYVVPHTYEFWEFFYREITGKNYKNFIELGGFPGYYTVFIHKFFHLKSSLLDFVFIKDVFENLCEKNLIDPNLIEVHSCDLFDFSPKDKYDVVFSGGLIEHFESLTAIINEHLRLCNSNGTIIMTMPNFRGLYGLTQFIWFRDNLKKHNLKSMKLSNLKSVLQQYKDSGLIDSYKVDFYGTYSTHLDNLETLSNRQRKIHSVFTSIVACCARWISLKRWFSPNIVITLTKAK